MKGFSGLYMRFPGGKAKAVTLSYDDGVEQDLRLVKIMDAHGLKGTFNVCSGLFAPEGTTYPAEQIRRRVLSQTQIKELSEVYGQEIAVHTLEHVHLGQFPLATSVYQIIEDRRRLEELLGCTIRGLVVPFGEVTDEIIEVVKNSGFSYARKTQSTEDFWLPSHWRLSNDWMRFSPTCHHNNPRLMELTDKFLGLKAEKNPRLFYLWGHSYEFDEKDNWEVIEAFAEKMGENESIWYATNIQIFDYVAAYQQLRFGVDMKFVENPTATDLFFKYNEKDYMVKAGACISLSVD